MDRRDLESTAAYATYLRGLLAVPLGLLFIVTGLGNLGWGPLRHPGVFVGSLVAIGAFGLALNRYYNDNYGRVTHVHRRQVRDTVGSAVTFGGAMVGGSILDFTFQLPVSLFTASFAVGMLVWFAMTTGLRAHHVAIWGSLLVAGLLPVWGSLPDRVSVAWLPIGVATMTAGIFDHIALRRTFGPARAPENRHVGA